MYAIVCKLFFGCHFTVLLWTVVFKHAEWHQLSFKLKGLSVSSFFQSHYSPWKKKGCFIVKMILSYWPMIQIQKVQLSHFSCTHSPFTCALHFSLFALTVHSPVFTKSSPCTHRSFSIHLLISRIILYFGWWKYIEEVFFVIFIFITDETQCKDIIPETL